MKGLFIALLLNPFMAVFWLMGPVVIALVIWRYMPDSKVKRVLFKSYGEDSGPWMRAPWQRKRTAIAPIEATEDHDGPARPN